MAMVNVDSIALRAVTALLLASSKDQRTAGVETIPRLTAAYTFHFL